MMTPSELLTYLRAQSAEDSTSFWSDSELYTHMTTGEREIARITGITRDTTSFTTGDGTREYTIANDIGRIRRLTWDSYRCKAIDINQLDDIEGYEYGGSDTTGYPEYYYRWGETTIGFSPVPDSAKTVNIYHDKVPASIDSSSTGWTIPDRYGEYIGDYCLWQMFAKDQQLNDSALMYAQKWQNDIKIIEYDYKKLQNADQHPTVNAVDAIFVD